jgi:hypothetical protein
MKSISSTAMSALVGALVCCFTPAVAMDDHTVLKPNDVKWGPGPASIPKGAQAAACPPSALIGQNGRIE